MTEYSTSKDERAEMLRAHTGIVTAFIQDDRSAIEAQAGGVLRDIVERSDGDTTWITLRLEKQLEAGAFATWQVVRMLAPRAGLTAEEVNRIMAEVYAEGIF